MAGPGKLMNPRMTLKVYPRPDTFYRGKSSFNFDAMRSKIMLERDRSKEVIYLWLAHAICGIIIAPIGFFVMSCENIITEQKTHYL
jgi:hypothetical protein